jgi:anthranilate synthase component 2
MILVIDNYDSFTYNIVQYLGELGEHVEVVRNDALDVAGVRALAPERIVISPGPGTPDSSGVSLDVLRTMGETTPILGVCLGHQAIGQVFGGRVVRAPRLMHGKISLMYHTGDPMFAEVPSPFEATRYHSLIVEDDGFPECLIVTARTSDGEIMALRHRDQPIFGVQFHPESILTQGGMQMLRNFCAVPVPAAV